MNKMLYIVAFFISCTVTKAPVIVVDVTGTTATKYIYRLKTNSEVGVREYKLQQSSNNKNWNTVYPFLPKHQPDSNWYSYALATPRTNKYYRVVATMTNSAPYITKSLYLKVK